MKQKYAASTERCGLVIEVGTGNTAYIMKFRTRRIVGI
jgi:hypothetical protein